MGDVPVLYTVFGDGDTALLGTNSYQTALGWVKGYTARGDFGGHDCIRIVAGADPEGEELFSLDAPEQTISDDDGTEGQDRESYSDDQDRNEYRPGGAFCDQDDALDHDIGDHAFSGRISAGDY